MFDVEILTLAPACLGHWRVRQTGSALLLLAEEETSGEPGGAERDCRDCRDCSRLQGGAGTCSLHTVDPSNKIVDTSLPRLLNIHFGTKQKIG